MAIYDKPTWSLMKEMVESFHLKKDQIFTKQQAVSWFHQHYPRLKEGTITAHLIRLSTNAPSRVHYKPQPNQDDVLYQVDSSRFRLFDAANDPVPIYNESKAVSTALQPKDEGSENPEFLSEFAYEKDLQNFLAKNLGLIEPTLRLYSEEGINGLEFPAGGRYIDILAVDEQSNYVVIELKVSKGYDRVVGQLLRYIAWIKQNHAEPTQSVRGIIIAREISEDLILACSGIPNVTLYEYNLAVSLRQVGKIGL